MPGSGGYSRVRASRLARALRARVWAGVLGVAVAASALVLPALNAQAAGTNVVVTVTVPSAITLTNYCSQPAAWNLGTVLPGDDALSSTDGAAPSGSGVCRFEYQSSNGDAQIRVGQTDRDGTAMATRAGSVDLTGGTGGWYGLGVAEFDVSSTAGTGFYVQFGTGTPKLFKSTNSGSSWTDQSIPAPPVTGCNAGDVAVTNDTTVFVTCAWTNRVHKITQAGTWSWSAAMTHGGGGGSEVFAIDSPAGTDTLWACFDSATKVRYTTNASAGSPTWNTPPGLAGMTGACTDVHSVDSNVTWIVDSDGNAFKTTTGTDLAAAGNTGLNSLRQDVFGLSATHAWALRWYGSEANRVARTVDGGANWTESSLPTGPAEMDGDEVYKIVATSINDVYVFGMSGVIHYSDDGGVTWTTRHATTGNRLTAATVFPGSIIAAGGNGNTVHRSTDGITWNQIGTETTAIVDLSAATAQTLWTVAGAGSVRKSTNGGSSFAEQGPITTRSLMDVEAVDTQRVWVVGTYGTIYRTENGGTSWQQQASGTTEHLYAIDAVDRNTAWAVGTGGTLLKTGNGGASWTPQASGTTNTIVSISAISDRVAWFGSDGSMTKRTLDGGQTWTATATNCGCDYEAVVVATDANTAFATGGWGQFWKTTNGGASWTTIWTGQNVNSLDAVDSHTAFLVENGNLHATDDGFASWTTISNPTVGNVEALDANTYWVWNHEGSLDGSTLATSVPDWVSGAGEWTNTATPQFGFCMQDVFGANAFADAAYTEDGNTCTATDPDPWYPIPATTSRVSYTTGIGNTGRVDLVWGFRSGTAQPAGSYRATVLIEALSPAV